MVKKLSVKRPKLLTHNYIDITVQICANILIMAFLICIILYISEINTYTIVSTDPNDGDGNFTKKVGSIKTTMQRFINIMAWIMIITIGLSAFISIV